MDCLIIRLAVRSGLPVSAAIKQSNNQTIKPFNSTNFGS
jgi:hypothetical protein